MKTIRFVPLGIAMTALACTVTTTDNFQNPPPPPPATCATSDAVLGCTAGSVGYVCASDRPDDGDTDLVCSAGSAAATGTSYCCLPYAQYFTDCTPSNVAGCADPAFGFSCTGETAPSDADSRLACSAGIASGGAITYCCVGSDVTPTCVAAPGLACSGAAIGFSCTGNASPGDGDAPVACDVGTDGEAGATSHCCVPFAQSPKGCEEAENIGCGAAQLGFSCAGAFRPETWNASLTCAAAAISGAYCCSLE